MKRIWTLAVLVLALGLTAAGCGTENAGASASRWDREDRATQYLNEARGPLSDGLYTADEEGKVEGFRQSDARAGLTEAGRDMKNAGRDLVRGARDAAKNAGDMAEEAIDDAVDNAQADRAQAQRDRAAHIASPATE